MNKKVLFFTFSLVFLGSSEVFSMFKFCGGGRFTLDGLGSNPAFDDFVDELERDGLAGDSGVDDATSPEDTQQAERGIGSEDLDELERVLSEEEPQQSSGSAGAHLITDELIDELIKEIEGESGVPAPNLFQPKQARLGKRVETVMAGIELLKGSIEDSQFNGLLRLLGPAINKLKSAQYMGDLRDIEDTCNLVQKTIKNLRLNPRNLEQEVAAIGDQQQDLRKEACAAIGLCKKSLEDLRGLKKARCFNGGYFQMLFQRAISGFQQNITSLEARADSATGMRSLKRLCKDVNQVLQDISEKVAVFRGMVQ